MKSIFKQLHIEFTNKYQNLIILNIYIIPKTICPSNRQNESSKTVGLPPQQQAEQVNKTVGLSQLRGVDNVITHVKAGFIHRVDNVITNFKGGFINFTQLATNQKKVFGNEGLSEFAFLDFLPSSNQLSQPH
ncbi:unnamed protein product [Paramecium octaurelia]|uniref:Uncharacterized protein n=1 Tax=Paramecium octaurelia TaxID=43137 RepID=A0A8S1VN96_PAROT|nr:unnamed protein product [Paramecium octaurelia]